MVYIVMGVSGCGKSTIGRLLGKSLGIPFLDGDDFHPVSNLEKMARGEPLSDADRRPWLEAICDAIRTSAGRDIVVACSALREAYRDFLADCGKPVTWIVLHGDTTLIHERMSVRKDHFFPADLLQSQADTFEPPRGAWHFDISNPPEVIVSHIIGRIGLESKKGDVGLIGLGTMGANLALNIARGGWSVSVYNREVPGLEENIAADFVERHNQQANLHPFSDLKPFVTSLKRPRTLFLMITAGPAIDELLEELSIYLESGDLVVDGGNSHYLDTERRATLLGSEFIGYCGMGVSGGREGALSGASIMPGGSRADYDRLKPVLDVIAARDPEGNPCHAYMGPGGAGHFVKMVHNGIEYAEMQLIAECYALMRDGLRMDNTGIADELERWRDTDDSYLQDITIRILRTHDDKGDILDRISDQASHKGTGRWSVEEALALGVPCDTIAASLLARQISAQKKLRNDLHQMRTDQAKSTVVIPADDIRKGYHVARLVNHAIGFQILNQASEIYSWNIDLQEVARIWTGGCIIRSGVVRNLSKTLGRRCEHLFTLPETARSVAEGLPYIKRVVTAAVSVEVGIPALSAALNYILNFTCQRLPTNLIQAQRDFFGDHGFGMDDDPGRVFHYNWNGDDA